MTEWKHGCEYIEKKDGHCKVIDCPKQGNCRAYYKELWKQCPMNAHQIDYRPEGCPLEASNG